MSSVTAMLDSFRKTPEVESSSLSLNDPRYPVGVRLSFCQVETLLKKQDTIK